MAPQTVLVHGPLVGPSTWRWVAQELRAHRVDVIVPHLRVDTSADDPFTQLISDVASQVASDDVVLVGHSGAGVLLPFISDASSAQRARFVFVDAGLPPLAGPLDLADPEFRAFLHGHVEQDGLLPPWHTWWGEEGMRYMVPDDERRAAVTADIRRLPLSYYDSAPVVAGGWSAQPAGYVLLSESYRACADQARAWGWKVIEVLGTHLELVRRPEDVAASIIDIATW